MDSQARSDVLSGIARLARRLPTSRIESFCTALETGDVDSAAKIFPNANSRIEAQQLVDAWMSTSDPDVRQLAWALRAAAATDDAWRDAQQFELVWTGPSESGETFRRTDQALLELIDSAQRDLWIVSFVAYKIDAIDGALTAAIDRGVSVSMLLETRQESGGKIDFDGSNAFRESVRRRARLYVWPHGHRPESDGKKGVIHAKCAVADSQVLLISSANLTDAAMNLNLELGLMISGGKLPRTVTESLEQMVANEALTELS